VYLYDSPEGGFLHYKLLLADRQLAAFGSVNFNFRSQHLSREISFVYDDRAIGEEAYGNLETLLKDARKIGREEASTYRSLKYALIHAIMLIGG
jgi:phosphatidylserine/phosphatidylglycerophosphate/cardiolipin synthase-like enzyme